MTGHWKIYCFFSVTCYLTCFLHFHCLYRIYFTTLQMEDEIVSVVKPPPELWSLCTTHWTVLSNRKWLTVRTCASLVMWWTPTWPSGVPQGLWNGNSFLMMRICRMSMKNASELVKKLVVQQRNQHVVQDLMKRKLDTWIVCVQAVYINYML